MDWRAFAAFAEDQVHVQSSTPMLHRLRPPVTPVPEDAVPPSGHLGNCTYVHRPNTHTHKNK